MWRLAVFALVLCGGCASPGHEPSLLEDGLWGDVRSLFSTTDDQAPTAPKAMLDPNHYITPTSPSERPGSSPPG